MLLLLIVFNLLLYKTGKFERLLIKYLCLNYFIVIYSIFLWESYEISRYELGTLLYIKPEFIMNAILVLLSILLIALLLYVKYVLLKNELIKRSFKMKKFQKIFFCLFSVFTFAGILLVESSRWATEYFDGLRIDQIIYTLSQPLKGTDPQQLINFVTGPFFYAIFYTTFILSGFYFLSAYVINRNYLNKRLITIQKSALNISPIIGVFILFFAVNKSITLIGKEEVKTYFFETTSLYEEYYVEPHKVSIEFTEKKNLIYIMLESMESSFTSEDLGGYGTENLIPNLTRLALEEGVHFSNGGKIGGAHQVPGTTQTVTGTVAQTAGIPVRMAINIKDYGINQTEGYLPGAHSLGKVLEEEGYEQMYFIGSDASFAGRDAYFSEHGNFEIRDLYWAREEGLIPKDYYEWWGIEDEKLYEFAKDSLRELANRGEPFNFTMLTTNTHFPNGYLSEETEMVYEEQYSNVILHADKLVNDFIYWIKQQNFYEDTIIVVVGDHLSMDEEYFSGWDEKYERTIYNLFLNTDKQPIKSINRQFTPLDLYATTLSAMTAEIEGDRLGLGVDLFSNEPTIVEEIGLYNFSNELLKRSGYYQKNILRGSDINSGMNN